MSDTLEKHYRAADVEARNPGSDTESETDSEDDEPRIVLDASGMPCVARVTGRA